MKAGWTWIMSAAMALSALAALVMLDSGAVRAQEKSPQEKDKASPEKDKQKAKQKMPLRVACGVYGDAEAICGVQAPEDLEQTPDGKFLLIPQFMNGPGAPGPDSKMGALMLFDIAKKTFTKLAPTIDRLKAWGEASCPGWMGDEFGPHGISLAKRTDGKWELYVVNHGKRQSIEMFELRPDGAAWRMLWHGCVVTKSEFNDVAALKDGSFIATHPQSLVDQTEEEELAKGATKEDAKSKAKGRGLFAGQATGWVVRWTREQGEQELPGTRAAYPNGVVADGNFAYYALYPAKEVRKYDLRAEKEIGSVQLDFMPDNVTWTRDGNILAAGIKATSGECPAGSGQFCRQAFMVAYIDVGKMTQKAVADSNGRPLVITGVSSALEVGKDVYLGSYEGDRIVKLPWKE